MFGYRGDGGDLVIQEEVTVIDQEDENQVDGGCDFRLLHPVTSINYVQQCGKNDCYFYIPNNHLYKIKLSKNLKEPSKNAFAHCEQMREISIPDGVETLGKEMISWPMRFQQGGNL